MRIVLMQLALVGMTLSFSSHARAEDPWLDLSGAAGPGKGKSIVLVSGDEEYRSEETLPQLAKILATHHGFHCTVLFAIDPKDGTINPNIRNNIPGLEKLASADLMVIFTRFRDLPDEQMRHLVQYLEAGKPVIGLRTATHAFDCKEHQTYSRFSWNSKQWDGGFGRQILGETWISHHGQHGKQGTRGILAPGLENHPVLRGLHDGDIFGTSDVYGVRLPLPGDCKPIVLGEVTAGLNPNSPRVTGNVNDPMMPVAWVKTYASKQGNTGRVFTSTLGASEDLLSPGTRRLLVNACYWCMGMEAQLPERAAVDLVGEFKPSQFKFNGFVPGKKPSDYRN
jgi:type 1 glutamine amidotransferase